jgi:hypothetical protein
MELCMPYMPKPDTTVKDLNDFFRRFLFGHQFDIPGVAQLIRIPGNTSACHTDKIDFFKFWAAYVPGIGCGDPATVTDHRFGQLDRVA